MLFGAGNAQGKAKESMKYDSDSLWSLSREIPYILFVY